MECERNEEHKIEVLKCMAVKFFLYYWDSSTKYSDQRLEDIWDQYGLHNKFQYKSQYCIVTPCLKQTNKAK